MNTRSYTALIPGSIAWMPAPNPAYPSDPAKPARLWRDNVVAQQAASYGVGGAGWWGPVTIPGTRSYRVIARDAAGKPKLTPIPPKNTSAGMAPEFYSTYASLSVVIAYQTFAFLFPAGVPYIETVTLSADDVRDPNPLGSQPGVDYPIELPSDTMLMLDASGNVIAVNYQDFAAAQKPPMQTDEERLAAIQRIVAGPSTAADKVQMIRLIVTNAVVVTQLT